MMGMGCQSYIVKGEMPMIKSMSDHPVLEVRYEVDWMEEGVSVGYTGT
jgi:hypothetical protein